MNAISIKNNNTTLKNVGCDFLNKYDVVKEMYFESEYSYSVDNTQAINFFHFFKKLFFYDRKEKKFYNKWRMLNKWNINYHYYVYHNIIKIFEIDNDDNQYWIDYSWLRELIYEKCEQYFKYEDFDVEQLVLSIEYFSKILLIQSVIWWPYKILWFTKKTSKNNLKLIYKMNQIRLWACFLELYFMNISWHKDFKYQVKQKEYWTKEICEWLIYHFTEEQDRKINNKWEILEDIFSLLNCNVRNLKIEFQENKFKNEKYLYISVLNNENKYEFWTHIILNKINQYKHNLYERFESILENYVWNEEDKIFILKTIKENCF